MSANTDISLLLEPVVTAHGVEIDSLNLSGSGKHRVLEVVIDSDDPIDLDDVATVSRAVSAALDESDVMGSGAYTLEVSSRGVSSPLTRQAHWRRNIGRLVHVVGSGIDLVGRISAVEGDLVTLEAKGQMKKLAIGDISRAVVEVEFNRKDEV